tara:strand:+ start:13112 stop:13570 length:459 start_codon:yes stop_codon:yes gene_type:complete
MTLEELKYVLDQMYDFDIGRKTRKREVVYAKKVFIKLAKEYGYNWIDMKKFVNLQHDNCIFHYKSFGDIKPMDLEKYNAAIDYFNLPMMKYPTVSAINGSPLFDNIVYQLSGLGRRDMKYFNDKVLIPFFKKLDNEEKIKNISKRAHHDQVN